MQSDLIAQLQSLEESHLAPAVRTDRTRLAYLLHETFIEIGASGQIHTRDEILEQLADEPPTTRTLENFHAKPLAENIVLTTYTVTQPDRRSRRSSVWIREQDAWRLIHHQGTPF